jgi:hypothetical protein
MRTIVSRHPQTAPASDRPPPGSDSPTPGANVRDCKRRNTCAVHVVVHEGLRNVDSELAYLQDVTRLSTLNLGRSKVTDTGLAHVVQLTGLQRLDLSETKVTDAGIAQLASLSDLQVLLVEGTAVTDAGREKLLRARPQPTFSAPRLRVRAVPIRTNLGTAQVAVKGVLLRYAEQSDATADADVRAWRRKQHGFRQTVSRAGGRLMVTQNRGTAAVPRYIYRRGPG